MGLEQIKVELLSSWQGKAGGDGTVAHAAWASSVNFEKLETKTPEDIRRLATNVVTQHHDSPKERLWMEFFLTIPIFVERQYDKYRMTVQHQDFQVEFLERPMGGQNISQNELSGRYRTLPERFIDMPNDVVNVCKKALGETEGEIWMDWWHDSLARQHEEYRERLKILKDCEKAGKISNTEYKRAREILRGHCGTATMTDMRISMNLNAFEHIINQRLVKAAQDESRAVAYLMLNAVMEAKVAPATIAEMIQVNGWLPLYWEVNKMLKDEVPYEPPPDIEEYVPTAEDEIWLDILASTKRYLYMDYSDLIEELTDSGMPEDLIHHFLNVGMLKAPGG